jgi:acetoin:2,6-dichlorophenolindophenol oxidoreductase subunit beta
MRIRARRRRPDRHAGVRLVEGPIELVTPPHTPVPFSPVLEQAWLPNAARIEAAIRKVVSA